MSRTLNEESGASRMRRQLIDQEQEQEAELLATERAEAAARVRLLDQTNARIEHLNSNLEIVRAELDQLHEALRTAPMRAPVSAAPERLPEPLPEPRSSGWLMVFCLVLVIGGAGAFAYITWWNDQHTVPPSSLASALSSEASIRAAIGPQPPAVGALLASSVPSTPPTPSAVAPLPSASAPELVIHEPVINQPAMPTPPTASPSVGSEPVAPRDTASAPDASWKPAPVAATVAPRSPVVPSQTETIIPTVDSSVAIPVTTIDVASPSIVSSPIPAPKVEVSSAEPSSPTPSSMPSLPQVMPPAPAVAVPPERTAAQPSTSAPGSASDLAPIEPAPSAASQSTTQSSGGPFHL